MGNLKKLTKKALSCLLAMAMVITSITVYPTVTANAGSDIDHFNGEGSFETVDPSSSNSSWTVNCDDWTGVSFGRNTIGSWEKGGTGYSASAIGDYGLKFWIENEAGATVTVSKTFAVLSAGTYTLTGYIEGGSNDVDDLPSLQAYRGVSGSETTYGTATTSVDGDTQAWSTFTYQFTLTEAVYNYTVGVAVNLYYTSWGYVDGFTLTGPEVDEADELDYDFVWHSDWNDGYGMYEYDQPIVTVEKGDTSWTAPDTINAALQAELPNDQGTYSTWGTADAVWETDGEYGLGVVDVDTIGEYYVRGTATYGSSSTNPDNGYIWMTVQVIPENIVSNPGFEDYEDDTDDAYPEVNIASDWEFWDDEADDSKSTTMGVLTEMPRSGLASYSLWADSSYTYSLYQEVTAPVTGLYKFSFYYVGNKNYLDTDEASETYGDIVAEGDEIIYAFLSYGEDMGEEAVAFTGTQDDDSYINIYADYYQQLSTEYVFIEAGETDAITIYVEAPGGEWVAIDDVHYGCWVDMTELADAISAYEALNPDDYTSASWTASDVDAIYTTAVELYGNVEATQASVDKITETLNAAIDSLVIG
ncbi:MAG: hypothetical protein ACI4DS_07695, partial [Eubacterium sp.]